MLISFAHSRACLSVRAPYSAAPARRSIFDGFGPVLHLKMAIRESREISCNLQVTNRYCLEGGWRRSRLRFLRLAADAHGCVS